jgi:hypothetical protein
MDGADVPAFERIHQLAGGFQTSAHEHCLLANHAQGIFEEAGFVFAAWRRTRRHIVGAGWV